MTQSTEGQSTLSGALLAVIVARLLSKPVRALADDVRASWQPGKPLQGHNRNDEIGVLSRALGDLIERMESALSREKAVTRYASHDMRTPVSVIRIALSVLNMPDCDAEKRQRNLQRIDAACAEIEERIEVHLCLARESAELPEEDCGIRTMIDDELAKHKHVIDAKNLSVTVLGDNTMHTTRSMLRVVLSNLIQNAVNYADQTLEVAIKPDEFSIANSADANRTRTNENGMGLEIVQRVCDRMGWEFSARREGGEFTARVGTPTINQNDESRAGE